MQPRCPECGVARGDEHEPNCSRHDVEYTPPPPPTPRPRNPITPNPGVPEKRPRPEPRGPDPFIAADPFWGPIRPRRRRLRRWLQGTIVIPRWGWLIVTLALGLNLLRMGVQFVVDHTGPDPVARPCMIQIQGFDRGDSGTWVKLYPDNFDCPPVSQWPVLIMRTPPPSGKV